VVKNAANSGDPNIRNATFVKGNVIWLALNQVGGTISQQEKELIMSVIGSVILYPPADDGSGAMPRYIEPSIVGLRDLLLGSGASATEGNVDIEVYVCDEPAECLNPVRTTVSAKPFTRLVSERLRRLSDNIATRTPQTPADIGFINNTTEPVYKMLAVANAVPGSNTAETLIETYKDVIALDYAETFLNRAIRQALSALSQTLKRTGGRAAVRGDIAPERPGSPPAAARREADRLRQGALGLVHDAGLADPGTTTLEFDAIDGESDARLQRQFGRTRFLAD
jgi:conjugative transfer pilus assembly protein TraH